MTDMQAWDDAGYPRSAEIQEIPPVTTQTRYPWRTTVRTAFQLVTGIAPMVPLIIDASGLDEAAAPVAGAIAISAGITRVMALPAVEGFLRRWAPWLAAAPTSGSTS